MSCGTLHCYFNFQVLYRAFNSLNTMGVENVIYQDVVTCLVSFAVNSLVSSLIGIMFGFSAVLMCSCTNHVSVIEPLIVFVFGYMSFLSAEMLHHSGILSCVTFHVVLFCLV